MTGDPHGKYDFPDDGIERIVNVDMMLIVGKQLLLPGLFAAEQNYPQMPGLSGFADTLLTRRRADCQVCHRL